MLVPQREDLHGKLVPRSEKGQDGPGRVILAHPQKKRRTRFLRELGDVLKKCLSIPIEQVVQKVVNPRVRGWVDYFRHGNSGADLSFVHWQVEVRVRMLASRQRPKRKGRRPWTTWSPEEIYAQWKL